jgi:hypothetical protein
MDSNVGYFSFLFHLVPHNDKLTGGNVAQRNSYLTEAQ